MKKKKAFGPPVDILKLPCPMCGAKSEEMCKAGSALRKKVLFRPHNERIRLAVERHHKETKKDG